LIRACGGALPCNNSEKGSLEFWKNKSETEECVEAEQMYMKNNSTYFDLNKWILYYILQFFFVPLVKGKVHQLFFRVGSDNYFPLTSVK
jgi:hypothetical protein